jgi:hypothetical protein
MQAQLWVSLGTLSGRVVQLGKLRLRFYKT